VTAPARPVSRPDRPPTREQLIVLVDRAERGQLTAAEAGRLRQGIAALDAGRRSSGGRLADHRQQLQETAARLHAVEELIRTAVRRGRRHVMLQTLVATVDSVPALPAAEARQKPPVAV
jgi:hypothetical protein